MPQTTSTPCRVPVPLPFPSIATLAIGKLHNTQYKSICYHGDTLNALLIMSLVLETFCSRSIYLEFEIS